jgi:hypothetical protein
VYRTLPIPRALSVSPGYCGEVGSPQLVPKLYNTEKVCASAGVSHPRPKLIIASANRPENRIFINNPLRREYPVAVEASHSRLEAIGGQAERFCGWTNSSLVAKAGVLRLGANPVLWRGGNSGAYNLAMTDRILCSCVICPKCGTWIVVEREIRSGTKQGKFRATCGVPECGKEFEFEDRESRVFELPPAIFERRYFYRSELRHP